MCVDDKIIIRVELTIYGQVEQYFCSPGTHLLHTQNASSSAVVDGKDKSHGLMSDLESLFEDQALSDVVIITSAGTQDDCALTVMEMDCDNDEKRMASSSTALSVDVVDSSIINSKIQPSSDACTGNENTCTHDAVVTTATTTATITQFPAHKFILSLRSPVFRAMFGASMHESASNEVRILDVNAPVMQLFLRYCYTDQCSPEALELYADQLLAVACKYQVKGLEILCENHLCATLTVETAVHVLYLADLYEAVRLKQRALQFIAQNAKHVVAAEDFFERISPALCQEVVRTLAGLSSSSAHNSYGTPMGSPATAGVAPELPLTSSSSSSSSSRSRSASVAATSANANANATSSSPPGRTFPAF
mmetsp:Transcript_30352/g.51330  ORF Transcript_30352/g.51330 Transcript_30352/m.51330 type:complete len:365 (-) Transcript_30352:1292-2386(-)